MILKRFSFGEVFFWRGGGGGEKGKGGKGEEEVSMCT